MHFHLHRIGTLPMQSKVVFHFILLFTHAFSVGRRGSCTTGDNCYGEVARSTPDLHYELLSGRGLRVTHYLPDTTYLLRLSRSSGTFTGFLLRGSNSAGTNVGSFSDVHGGAPTAAVTNIIPPINRGIDSVQFKWTSPPAGEGNITFKGVAISTSEVEAWLTEFSVTECTPNCNGKGCGDDGCGGSCGTCPNGETCSGDQCECCANCDDDGCTNYCRSPPSGETYTADQSEAVYCPENSDSKKSHAERDALCGNVCLWSKKRSHCPDGYCRDNDCAACITGSQCAAALFACLDNDVCVGCSKDRGCAEGAKRESVSCEDVFAQLMAMCVLSSLPRASWQEECATTQFTTPTTTTTTIPSKDDGIGLLYLPERTTCFVEIIGYCFTKQFSIMVVVVVIVVTIFLVLTVK